VSTHTVTVSPLCVPGLVSTAVERRVPSTERNHDQDECDQDGRDDGVASVRGTHEGISAPGRQAPPGQCLIRIITASSDRPPVFEPCAHEVSG
jgi:hypothetical protein